MNSQNSGLITLLTDFGTKDYFVAAMKGVILSINREAQIIDLTHEIEPQNIRSASFALRACYRNFPEKTIFAAVVDPGVGSSRRAILVETKDYLFVAPDNGLLSFVFTGTEDFRVFELSNRRFFASKISSTFHGRDIFAPVAAHLSAGIAAEKFGEQIADFVSLPESGPRRTSAGEIEAEIIEIDRFGNLITNLKREDLPEKFSLEISGTTVNNLRNFFAESAPGEVFMIFGSADLLEIAVFKSSAAKILEASRGQKIRARSL